MKLPLIFLLSCLFSVPGFCPSDIVEREAKIFSAVRRVRPSPATYRPEVENLFFALYLLNRDIQSADLTYPQTLEIANELTAKHGFRISSPPFTEREYLIWRAARNELLSGTQAAAERHEIVADELRERIDRTAHWLEVPPTRVKIETSLHTLALPGSLGSQRAGKIDVSLNQRAGKLERVRELLEVIGSTEEGRIILADFLPLVARGEANIEHFSEAKKAELRQQHGDAAEAAALYMYDNETKKITVFVNAEAESGIVIDQLVHEMTHATDKENRERFNSRVARTQQLHDFTVQAAHRAAKRLGINVLKIQLKHLSEEDTEKIKEMESQLHINTDRATLLAESKAFRSQGRFREQLIAQFPQAGPYYEAHIQRTDLFPSDVSLAWIAYQYDISSTIITEAPTNVCRNVEAAAGK